MSVLSSAKIKYAQVKCTYQVTNAPISTFSLWGEVFFSAYCVKVDSKYMKKKVLAALLACTMVFTACGSQPAASNTPAPKAETETQTTEQTTEAAPAEVEEELTGIDLIIKEAEGMTLEELAKKAIEESNGKTFYGVGNSSRGKSALPKFIEYLQSIDSSYNMEFEWQQPKNNKIF